jgi:hypothetical protein
MNIRVGKFHDKQRCLDNKCGYDQFGIRQPLAYEFCKDGKKPVAILVFVFVGKVN